MPRVNDIGAAAKPFVDKIESINADIEKLKSEFMAQCKRRRRQIRDCVSDAKDAGIAVAPLKGIIKQRALNKKIQVIPADFDIDEAAQYRALEEALGPLGQAAAIRAGYGAVDLGPAGVEGLSCPGAVGVPETPEQRKQREHEAAIQTVGRGPLVS